MTGGRSDRTARAAQMREQREKADRRQRNLITVAIVAVVVVLIAVGAYAVSVAGKDDSTAVAPRNVNGDFGILYTKAAADADPVRVVLYEDFLCPGCGALEQTAGSFLTSAVASGEIEIEYRPYAFLLEQSTNEYSQRAWNAAACVVDQGGPDAFKAFHDILFANQPQEGTAGPEDAELIAFAKQAGVTGIEGCVDDRTFTPWVEDALDQGKKDGIGGTPAVVIDGEQVEGAGGTVPTVADIQKAIDAAKP